jgi:hypothetical protein
MSCCGGQAFTYLCSEVPDRREQYEMGIGDYKTRNLLTWAAELRKRSPTQYARPELLIADGLTMPLDDRAVLALQN